MSMIMNGFKRLIKLNTLLLTLILLMGVQLVASYGYGITVEEQNLINENEKDITSQLNSYKSMSKWLVDNQQQFQQVLNETAKKSKTKWIHESDIKETTIPTSLPKSFATGENSQEIIYHDVKPHETLYSIAKIYGVDPSDLIKLNNLTEDGLIYVGQHLLIKIIGTEAPVVNNLSPLDNNLETNTFEGGYFQYPTYKYYQVQKGDTLYSISREVNMTPQEIISYNNLEKENIYPGMILKINARYQEMQGNNKEKFDWPLVGRLLISYGPQRSGMVSEGINIMAKKGANVKTVADGVVIYVGNGVKSLGNLVLIQHQDGWVSVYGYLENITVKKGQEINKGRIIGKVGKPSHIKVPQLHFELRQNVTPKDPLEYLNSYT